MTADYPIKSPRKLIEVALPLDAINSACSREKSIRHGHPSTLHLWWARRPLAAARAVIFAQLVNDPAGPWETRNPGQRPNKQQRGEFTKRCKELFEIIEKLVLWKNTTEEKVLEPARAEIRRSWREVCELNKDHPQAAELFDPDKLPALHDPFAGGGAIPLEAQRLGLEAYASDLNPTGSTRHVRFNTSKTDRWQTSSKSCHINWVVLDSDWEGEFCRVAEAHPKVRAYVKNHGLGLEVPYRYGSEMRKYLPDFIVLVDDGQGDDDLRHLVVEFTGYRGEDAIEKKSTMDTYWVPGVNHLATYGRWAFAEFTEVYQIESEFKAKVENEFNKMIEGLAHEN